MQQSFDHIVQVRESKTGRIIEERNYILHINDKGTRYERPPHSGKFYAADGSLVEDHSAAREKAMREKQELEAKLAADRLEAEEKAKREKLKAEVRAEYEAEIKAAKEKEEKEFLELERQEAAEKASKSKKAG